MSRKSNEEKEKLSNYLTCLESIVSLRPSIDDLVLQIKDIAEEYCPKINNLKRNNAKRILIFSSINLALNANAVSLMKRAGIKNESELAKAFDETAKFILSCISASVSDETAKEALSEYQAINNKNNGENNENH